MIYYITLLLLSVQLLGQNGVHSPHIMNWTTRLSTILHISKTGETILVQSIQSSNKTTNIPIGRHEQPFGLDCGEHWNNLYNLRIGIISIIQQPE